MHSDDLPVGRVLTRRETLALLGSAGALFLLGSAQASPAGRKAPCVVRPASTEGPFYVDERLNRSDIRGDPSDGSIKEGALLALSLHLSRVGSSGCPPIEGAVVDLWHCDALGVYSDVKDPRFYDSTGRRFLRGYQVTDQDGMVRFTTIFPGWYPTRTPHIHYKIRSPESARIPYEFVGQMYFEEGISDRVYSRPPYAGRGKRPVSNLTDGIFTRDGGRQSLLIVKPHENGLAGSFEVALDLEGGK